MPGTSRLTAILLAAATVPAVLPQTSSGDPGHVYFQRLAAPELDRYTNSPNPIQQKWFRDHFYRMAVFSPYFDAKTSWYPDGLVYYNLYGVEPESPILHQHPEWILH